MAELVGSALLSAFFSVLFDKLATEEVKNFLRPKKVINKQLKDLKVLLWSADKLLDDAEEKLIYDPVVENWHNELKDVVYKANELADTIEAEALRRNLERHQSASNMIKKFKKLCSTFDNYVKKELEEIIPSLEHLLSQKDSLGLEPAGRSNCSGVRTRVSERSRLTPVADESTFCGREDIKETIIQSLRSADVRGQKMGVIPIIGAGGLGKTTLARIIYDHPDVKEHFPVRAWVIVSTEFDLPAITKKIMVKVSGSSQIDENDDELPSKLKDALKGKKFLLVLDDVWSESHHNWNTFKSYFQSAEHGSRIIVTTRSKKVASIVAPNQPHHELPVLPEEDCLKLFDQTVFSDVQDLDEYRHLQEIGKKIVNKCKGNPLSVVCVGGILGGERDPEKWEKVLESSVWELLQKEEDSRYIIPSLWLSYRYLPSHLKRCFAYCSIFPKDYLFRKEQMVQLWMAEGFLKNKAGSTMEEVGKQYFEDLISRSLFQTSSDDGETIMMHDLVHDLALYVSGKFCFWLDKDKILRDLACEIDLACETRHLSYNLDIVDAEKFEGLSKAKRLHSFVGLLPGYHTRDVGSFNVLKMLEKFSMEGACLRVLSLSSRFYRIDSLPDSMGKLKHLRYLNLSETKVTKLPDSICTLYNLQTLLLSGCWRLTRLPNNLGSLINLRHLDTRDSSLEEMPPKMCNLKKLHTLTDFVLGEQSSSSIKDLGVLQDLHGRICVSGLQNVNNVDDALKADLKNKKNLSEVALEWGGQIQERDSGHEEKVLEALQPHANLKKLFISEYGGTRFPNWVGSVFPRLKEFQLKGCLKLVGGLPNCNTITTLHIEKCKNFLFPGNQCSYPSLESLYIKECCGSMKSFPLDHFPMLNKLVLKKLEWLVELTGESHNKLEKLSIKECSNLEFLGYSHYGSLKNLKIKNCEALKSIPLDYFPKLNRFHLWKCQNFESFRFGEEPPLVLEYLSLWNLPKFVSFPEGGLHAPNLKDFQVRNCGEIESWPEGGLPSNLESLEIWRCKKLAAQVTHWDLQTFTPCLESLDIDGCGEELLDSFPPGLLPTSLTRLLIRDFRGLKTLNIHAFQHLKGLYLHDCGELQFLPEESLPSNLESLCFWGCKKLAAQVKHWDLQTFTPCLKSFSIDGCGEELFDSFPPEGLLPTSLTRLSIWGFRRLKTLNIHAFQHLESLSLYNCGELQFLPEESLPNSLSILYIMDCPLLERRYQKETGEGWDKISHIPTVAINEREQHES